MEDENDGYRRRLVLLAVKYVEGLMETTYNLISPYDPRLNLANSKLESLNHV
jgi:hypothetical protein